MKKFDIDSFFAAVCGFFIVYLFTHHSSIGVSPDSVVYTSAARNLYYHGKLEAYNHMPLVDFPVLYPLFLSLSLFITRLDPVVTGGIINGLLFASLIYMCGHIMKQIMRPRLVKWALLLGLMLSPALLDIYTMLWSETLFIALSVVFILVTGWYFKQPSIARVTAVAICAGLACLTRYAGVTFIFTGCFLIFFHLPLRSKKRITHCIVFGLVSSAFFIGNLIRNAIITGTFTGNREKSTTSFFTNLYYYGKVLYYWLPFMKNSEVLVSVFAIVFLVTAIAIIIWRIRTNYNHESYQNIAMVFGIVYILFIVITASISRYETINNRLLIPAYAPLLLVTVYAFGRLSFKLMFFRKTLTIVMLSAAFLLFIASQALESYGMYREYNTWGIPGYTDDGWRNSPITQYLKQHPQVLNKQAAIYSNAHEAAYFTANVAAESLPHTVDKEDVETFLTADGHYLLWYGHIDDPDLVNTSFIRQHKNLTEVYSTSDGAIYWCTNKK